MHHRAHHIQHYHHNNYRNSEIFRKIQKTKRNIPFFVLSFSKSKEKFKSSQQKLTFWGRFCWEDEKRNSVILCQFNCWVVCLLKKKKENLWEKKNEEKKIKTEENCCSQLFQILLRLLFDFVKNSVILATLLLKLLSTTLHTT